MNVLPAEKVALAPFYYDEGRMPAPDGGHEERHGFLVFGSYRHNGVRTGGQYLTFTQLVYRHSILSTVVRKALIAASYAHPARGLMSTHNTRLNRQNRDALQWLATEIWPLIRQRLPDATCDVYGALPIGKDLAFDNKVRCCGCFCFWIAK
jgi:hypothetical protein